MRDLSIYRGERATQMLLKIALGKGPFVVGDTQTEAIKGPENRGDRRVGIALSALLQPHIGLNNRQAAAAALGHLPCDYDCDRLILHYLERVWGEPNYEDRNVIPPFFQDSAATIQTEQKKLYADLYGVLGREKEETFANLVKVYGLGTDGPSTFALEVVSRIGSHDACPLLLQSDGKVQKESPDLFKAPRHELQETLTSLGCK